MNSRISRSLCACILILSVVASSLTAAERPKLMVVVSVDQLCEDYFLRFADNFSEQGVFRRVLREGAHYTQCHHGHAYTITAPGHSVQMTGAYPATNGIVANNWFDRDSGKDVYCVGDSKEQIVGATDGKAMSPRNLLVDTVGDVLRLKTNNRSKVFGVAVKDRAAILMTGHNANAAFWMQENGWVTSTYYTSELPGYLRVINTGDFLQRFQGKTWELMYPLERYHNNGPDKNSWENPPKGLTGDFPHKITTPEEVGRDVFGDQVLFSPYGNDATLEAAREIVIHEKLGADEFPDILCINFSSNDYVGHAFGPHSLEVEDMTYRTDLQLGEFLRFLDEQVGKGNWAFALTADHGVAPVVEYAVQFNLPAKRNVLGSTKDVRAQLEKMLREKLSVPTDASPLIQKVDEAQVYLDRNHPQLIGDNYHKAQQLVRDWLIKQPFVATSMTADDLATVPSNKLGKALFRARHPRRSGDVLTVFQPYCVHGTRGTTHGTPWHYDTHVPMQLVGAGVDHGEFHRPVTPACLASTVAELLGVDYPGGNVEQPLREVLGR